MLLSIIKSCLYSCKNIQHLSSVLIFANKCYKLKCKEVNINRNMELREFFISGSISDCFLLFSFNDIILSYFHLETTLWLYLHRNYKGLSTKTLYLQVLLLADLENR